MWLDFVIISSERKKRNHRSNGSILIWFWLVIRSWSNINKHEERRSSKKSKKFGLKLRTDAVFRVKWMASQLECCRLWRKRKQQQQQQRAGKIVTYRSTRTTTAAGIPLRCGIVYHVGESWLDSIDGHDILSALAHHFLIIWLGTVFFISWQNSFNQTPIQYLALH